MSAHFPRHVKNSATLELIETEFAEVEAVSFGTTKFIFTGLNVPVFIHTRVQKAWVID